MKGFLNGIGTMLGIGMLCAISAFGGAVCMAVLYEENEKHNEKILTYLNEDIKNLRKDKEKLEEENKLLKEI